MGVVEIESVEQFDGILLNNDNQHEKKYIFVDFWASWCMPCKIISPTFHKFSDEYNKNVYYVSINIDNLEELSTRYNIKSIPTFKTFEVGSLETELEDFVGANKTKLGEKLKLLDEGIKLDEDF